MKGRRLGGRLVLILILVGVGVALWWAASPQDEVSQAGGRAALSLQSKSLLGASGTHGFTDKLDTRTRFEEIISAELPQGKLLEPGQLPLPKTMKRFMELAIIPIRSLSDQEEFLAIQSSEVIVKECEQILAQEAKGPFTWAEAVTRIQAVRVLEKLGSGRSGGPLALKRLVRTLLVESEEGAPLLVRKSRRGDLIELSRTLRTENAALFQAVLSEHQDLPKARWLLRSLSS
jgi:hypothetical protein